MRITAAIAISVSVLMTPVAAFAQASRPERPYRGLFGGGRGDTEQSLSGTVSAGAGYDDNVYASDAGGLLPVNDFVSRSSQFTSLNASLGYSLGRKKISVSANGSTSAQYYFDLLRPLVTSYGAGAGMSWSMSTRTSLSVSGGVDYSPFSAFSFFPEVFDLAPGELPPPNAQLPGHYGTIRSAFVGASSSASVSHQLSQRTSVSANIGRSSNYNTSGDYSAFSVSASANISYSLSKGLGVHAGYGFSRSEYVGYGASGVPIRGRFINAGIDYNKALSFSRRTSLSFATGSSAYSDVFSTNYFVTGNANLNHEIGRSWNAGVSFKRDVNFLNQLGAPMFSDSITGSLTGLLSRRVHFQTGVSTSSGQVGLHDANNFGSLSWTTGASFDTHQLVSLSVQYWYYRYNFVRTDFLIPGTPPEFDRQSVSANVSLFLPILQRARRPDASR